MDFEIKNREFRISLDLLLCTYLVIKIEAGWNFSL